MVGIDDSKLYADLILYNGNFITLDKSNPHASALAVLNGNILKVGGYDDVKGLIGKNTDKLDLQGKTVVPGFIDSHIHLISLGLAMQVLDLRGINKKSILIDKLIKKLEYTPPKHWVRGFGFNESTFDELPILSELDAISPHNPIYLEDINSKICIVNSLALKNVKIEKVGVINEINGIIRVENSNLLYEVARIPTIDPVDETLEESELEKAIEIAYPKLIEVGITSVHDVQLPPKGIVAFKKVSSKGKMPLRIYLGCDRNKNIELQEFINEGLGTEPYPDRIKIGLIKLFADGRMLIPEFKRRVKEAHNANYQLSIHSTDFKQVELSIDSIEEALKAFPKNNHRHKIEHAHTLNKELIKRIKNLELIVSTQPELISKFNRNYPDNIMAVPLYSMIKKGIKIAGGSDSPTISATKRATCPRTFPNPLIGISFEVSRKTENGSTVQEDEKISILEALKIHTINGAYASFEEESKGSLKAGKLADLVVLSDDPLNLIPEKIKNIKVEKTIIGGKVIYASTACMI